MATFEADKVVVELLAKTEGFDAKMTQSATTHEKSMATIERATDSAEKRVAKAASSRASSEDKAAKAAKISADVIADHQRKIGSNADFLASKIAAAEARKATATKTATSTIVAEAGKEVAATKATGAAHVAAAAVVVKAEGTKAAAVVTGGGKASGAIKTVQALLSGAGNPLVTLATSAQPAIAVMDTVGEAIGNVAENVGGGDGGGKKGLSGGVKLLATAFGGLGGVVGAIAVPALLAGAEALFRMLTGANETQEAIDALVEKMREQARQAELNERANKIWEASIDGVRAAQKKLTEEVERSLEVEPVQEQENLNKAVGNRKIQTDALAKATADLKQAEKDLADLRKQPGSRASGGVEGNPAIAGVERRIAKLKTTITTLNKDIAASDRTVRTLQIPLAQRQAENATNATKAIDDYFDVLERRITLAAQGNEKLTASLGSTLSSVARVRKAMQNAAEEGASTTGRSAVLTGLVRGLADGKIGADTFTRAADGMAKALDKAAAKAKRLADEAKKAGRSTSDAVSQTSFINPVESGVITGKFGELRDGGTRRHKGVDRRASVGTSVKAPAAGVIIESGVLPGYGNVVYIDHGRGTVTRLAHLSRIDAKKGDIVTQGQQIGLSGGAKGAAGSGTSQAPHVHEERLVNGRQVDPTRGSFRTDLAEVEAKAAKIREKAGRAAESDEAKRARLERQRLADVDRGIRRDQSADNAIAQAQQELIDARQALITSAEEIAKLEIASIEIARLAYNDRVASQLELKQLEADEAKALTDINDERAKLRTELVNRREAQRKFAMQEKAFEQAGELQSATNQNEQSVLQGQLELADTQKERRAIERRLLELQFQEERLQLNRIIAYNERVKDDLLLSDSIKSEAQTAATIAAMKLASLEERQASATEASDRGTAGPLESYFGNIKSEAGDINEAFESIAAGGLATFTDALTDAIVNFSSLGDVGRAVLQSITASLVKLAIQQVLAATIGKAISAGTTSATVAQMAVIGAAAAGPAALVATATAGAASVAANAGLATTAALAQIIGAPKARGGRILGPGTDTSDNILTPTSPDEFVIKASSARKLGFAALSRMNMTGTLPQLGEPLARGGRVGGFSGPANAAARAPQRRGGFSEGDINQLRGIVGDAAKAMPNVSLYASLDPADVLQRALGSPAGEKALIASLGRNSGRVKATIG